MKKTLFALTTLILLGLARLWSDTISTCSPNQSVRVGPYITQTDFWNKNCPGTQCVDIDDQTGAFTVTQNTPICPNVSSYPSIVFGRAWGQNSNQSVLPAQLDSLTSVISSWAFTPTYSGSWDAAYDIWICPDDSCGSSGFPGGAELMIWMDYYNTSGWQYDAGPATLSGKTWEVWQTEMGGSSQWKYVAYLSQTPVTAVSNMELNDFLKDSISRGYLKPDWYLYAVEAGNEMRKDGVPFTSHSFSVSVNPSTPSQTVYSEAAHPGMPAPAQAAPAAAPSNVIQNFLSRNPQEGKTFTDTLGSTLTYQVKDNPNKTGSKFLALHFDEKPGGSCGVVYPVQDQDWTGAKSVRFLIYSKTPVVIGFGFRDKNNLEYSADSPATKGTGWETIQIPINTFTTNPNTAPPDLSLVTSFTLQPKTAVQATLGIDSLTVVK